MQLTKDELINRIMLILFASSSNDQQKIKQLEKLFNTTELLN